MTGLWVAHDDEQETKAEDESFIQVDPFTRVTLRLKRPRDNPREPPAAKAARSKQFIFTQVPELSDDEVECQLKQEGLAVPESNNKTGIFGVYAVSSGGFKVWVTPAGVRPSKQVYMGFFTTRMRAALCVARTPEGQAKAKAAAAAAARGEAHAVRPRHRQRWDAGTRGAGQEEERAAAKKAHEEECAATKKAREDERAAAEKSREEERAVAEKARAEKRAAAKKAREEKVSRRRAECLRLREARREARRKEKARRLLAYCNAMKQHAANKVQRRKRHEAQRRKRERREDAERERREDAERARHEAQAEKRERREDAERAIDTAQAQLDAAEDAQLDDATRSALERFALGDKDSAKAALPRLLRIKVCQVYALDHQRSLFAKTKRERAANGAVDPPDPEGVAPVLNPARPWASACHAVLSSHLVTMLSPCHPTPPRLTPTSAPSSPPLAQPTAARRRSSTQRSAGSLRGART